MRNLKRALSLTLASVMLLGMMVVGSSAAAGYDDVKDTDNVEAIEVAQAIEVMVGDERGFGPDRPVNRAEMAVVMGKLLNLDYNYYATSCPFNDVYDWARGWVGACYANKIVSGRGEGVYDPGATVTAVEAASMLMRALGYFQYQNDYQDGFELSTVRMGTKIGIFDQVGSSATDPMTRNQVAQMVLNALQTGMVEPDGQTINLTTPEGQVYTGKVNYVNITSNKPFARAISSTQATSVGSTNDGAIVELGEQLYNGELKLYKYTDDDFMRPARTWEFDGKTIGTYMKKENIRETYTDGVSRRELYDLLGRSSLNDYDFKYYVDGVESTDITAANILTRTTKDYGTTGRGVLTQVFVDTEAETIDITSVNTWLAKATADYNATRESVVLNVYNNYTGTPSRTTTIAKTVGLADVPAVENVKKDQYVLVNWSGKDQANGVYEVVEIADVEILSNSTLTKFSKGSSSDPQSDKVGHEAIFSSVTTNGTEYKNSKKAYYSDEALDLYNNNLLTNKTYNVFLDKYGYAIGVDLYAGDDNYVFISGIKLNNSPIAVTRADANAIFTDGTAKTISVNVKDSNKNIETVQRGSLSGKAYFEKFGSTYYDADHENAVVNRWYTYTVDKDNVYTLTPAARMLTTRQAAAKTIKCDNVVLDRTVPTAGDTAPHATAAERIYGNDASVYIIPELDHVSGTSVTNKVITGVDGLYTGVQNVEIEVSYATGNNKLVVGSDNTELYDSVYAVYDKNNYVIAAVIVGEAKGTSANYAYILTAAESEEIIDDTYYWTFKAVVDGAEQKLTVKSKFANTINSLLPGHVQELRYTDEYVTSIKNVGMTKFYTNPAVEINENVHEVYDVGHVRHFSECVTSTDCSFTGYTYPTSARLSAATAPDLHVEGRTLKLGLDSAADHGLTLVSESTPAVVIQYEDNEKETRYYSSVSAALSSLGDADGNYTDGKLGFAGRITAVLNSQGVAKWVVINSDTPVNTKAGTITGSACEITIRRILNNGAGVTSELESVVQKVSTSTLSTRPDGSKYWTVTAPVVTGWIPFPATQTVTYNAGTRNYTISFTYTGGAASSAADITTATATGTGVTAGTVTPNGSNLEVAIDDTRDHFNEGDTIVVTSSAYSSNASLVSGNPITLTYKSGAWVADRTIVVKAQDGTTKTYSAVVKLKNVNTIASVAVNKVAGAGSASTFTVTGNSISGNVITVVVDSGTIDAKDTITVAPTLTGSSYATHSGTATLTNNGTAWNTAKITVTAQDGTTKEYTVKTGASSVAEINTATATAVGSLTSGTLTSSGIVNNTAKTVKITVTGAAAANDSIVVTLAAKAGGTVSPNRVILTRGASNWDTATVEVTAADGTTKSGNYTVSVEEVRAPASTSNAAVDKANVTIGAVAGGSETITVSATDGSPFTIGTPTAVAKSSNGTEDATKVVVAKASNTTITVTVGANDLTQGDTYEISIPLTAENGTSLTALKVTLTVGA